MNHRSIREFKPDPIDEDTLNILLQAGIRTATAGRLQHYALMVIDDDEVKRQLSKDMGGSQIVRSAPVTIIALADEYRLKQWFEVNDSSFHFNHIAIFLIAFWDAVIALHNIQVAAESLGLGGVYIGTVHEVDVYDILGAPEYTFPAGMLCLGYPNEDPPLRPRLPLEAVVHRNRYQIHSDDAIREFHHPLDGRWEVDLTAEEQQDFEARGIRNWAQRTALGHYTRDFVLRTSGRILANLRKAGFVLD
jgi:nitroreductase